MLTGKLLKVASLVLVAMAFAPSFASADQAEAQSTNQAEISQNVIYIIQGETSALDGKESENDFLEFHAITYELPWNVSSVYTSVPTDARNVTVLSGFQVLNNSEYGRVTTGAFAGSYKINVPSWHVRTATVSNTTNNSQSFGVPQAEFVNTTHTSGYLALQSGNSTGLYTSRWYSAEDSLTILSANLSWSGLNLENSSAWISNDNGTTWVSCPSNSTEVEFPANGTELRIMFELRGNTTAGSDARISGFTVTATSLLLKTSFPLHITYRWTSTFTGGMVSFNLTEPLPYSSSASSVVMLYLVRGFNATGHNMDLLYDRNGSLEDDENKDIYLNMSSRSGYVSISVDISAPPEQTNWALFMIIGAVIILAPLVIYFIRRQSTGGPEEQSATGTAESGHETGETLSLEDYEKRRAELVARKKALMADMESIKEGVASGKLSKADSEKNLVELKSEFKRTRNELNRIDRRRADVADGSGDDMFDVEIEEQYEAALTSLARIDDDFERGRLPEGTYKSLRKQYLEKAADLRAERSKSRFASLDPLDQEKVKLMEAIVALDEEHDLGKMDEKVYQDLRSSYKAELTEIMRKIEQQEKGG